MDINDKKRSMAHYVQAEHVKTRQKLAQREKFPVPAKGDIIIYNEIQKYHEKHDCAARRGVGIVSAVFGCHIVIKKMHKNNHFFNTSIRTIDFELGLYQYVSLEGLPKTCPEYDDMELGNLSDELRNIAITEGMPEAR